MNTERRERRYKKGGKTDKREKEEKFRSRWKRSLFGDILDSSGLLHQARRCFGIVCALLELYYSGLGALHILLVLYLLRTSVNSTGLNACVGNTNL
jgi:hypothetical protein